MSNDELLDIYDENFQYNTLPKGQKPRKEVHRDGDWHRGVHCWIICTRNDKGHIILQRRAAGKGDEAFALDITAAGHLKSGETAKDVIREIKEELGIDVDFSQLISVGTIIEVAEYNGKINREFDDVYFLENNSPIERYRLQLEEVDGLTEFSIADGILLFTKKVNSIPAVSVRIEQDEQGKIIKKGPYKHSIRIADFGGEDRGNYYIKILVLADLFYKKYPYLYI